MPVVPASAERFAGYVRRLCLCRGTFVSAVSILLVVAPTSGLPAQSLTQAAAEPARTFVVIAIGLFLLQTALIALMLLERQRRLRAQREVADQGAYERMIAELTTDAVRHTYDAPRALEDALGRIGTYSKASTVIFLRHDGDGEKARRPIAWQAANAGGSRGAKLEIPLITNGESIGILQLYRSADSDGWPIQLAGRMVAAGEIIAGAVARADSAQAVRSGEELNRAVLASLTTQIAILDSAGTIVRVNESWRELAQRGLRQYDHEGFVGANYLEECARASARGCDEALDIKRGIEAVLARKAQRFTFEHHCLLPDEKWYLLTVDRLEHEDGGAVVTHLDVTDRRIAERDAVETRRQIAHMGRVVLIGEMAAAISHELSQPLAAIRANAEAGARMLAGTVARPDEVQEIFADIITAGRRAGEVVDHIRMLLRNEPPKLTTVDLNDVCRSAVQLIKRDAALRGTRLELALDTELPTARGDPVQLQQVVLNLALNALDATRSSTRDREVRVGTAVAPEEVEIFVRDTGDGLPPDVQSHLFESFFSTKPNGLGLGLVIVRSIVERHSGRIRAENADSGGALFRVLLPRAIKV